MMGADCFPREGKHGLSDYRSKFLKEIAPHLDTDNMFIADVVPYTEQQYQFEVMKGDVDKVNTQTGCGGIPVGECVPGADRHFLVPHP